ncbi:MAG TPA: tRNA uridine-5-carboxymethylaminomethyl(34) synthesis GTPase MnmE, partial [Clostridiales bacterium]|nr:tRNA uridine-5-carboxymethylaminomethyl(34) synthesis GTPase MnmE [Clostridiales bacterium]
KKILELTLRYGARMAEPGEFTKRAFLNGRIDLAQAEAVIDLIRAKTDKGFDVAFHQMEGELSKRVKAIRDQILDLVSHIAVNIDFPDEDIEEITYQEIEKQAQDIHQKITKLLDTADTGRIIREGIHTVIIGKPNVGKSSLLNALLKESRAIVTEVPGTTRDVIEEFINIRGIPLKIVDTAGIRETEDQVEKLGVQRSKELFNKADLVIFVINASEPLSEEDWEIIELISEKQAIVLLNKTDLPMKIDEEEIQKIIPGKKIIKTSLVEGIGLEALENAIAEMIYGGTVQQNETFLVTNTRHKHALEKAKQSIEDAMRAVQEGMPLDLIEIDVKDTWEYLGEITGDTASEDIINAIFANFCLGK